MDSLQVKSILACENRAVNCAKVSRKLGVQNDHCLNRNIPQNNLIIFTVDWVWQVLRTSLSDQLLSN